MKSGAAVTVNDAGAETTGAASSDAAALNALATSVPFAESGFTRAVNVSVAVCPGASAASAGSSALDQVATPPATCGARTSESPAGSASVSATRVAGSVPSFFTESE